MSFLAEPWRSSLCGLAVQGVRLAPPLGISDTTRQSLLKLMLMVLDVRMMQRELQKRLDAERPEARNHLDMRHRLDKDGNRRVHATDCAKLVLGHVSSPPLVRVAA